MSIAKHTSQLSKHSMKSNNLGVTSTKVGNYNTAGGVNVPNL